MAARLLWEGTDSNSQWYWCVVICSLWILVLCGMHAVDGIYVGVWISIIAERLNVRQLILHRISPRRLYVRVCVCVTLQECMRLQQYPQQLYTCHTPSQVPAYMQHACTYSHQCSNRMNSDNRVRCLATLRKRKQREKDYSDWLKDFVNFNFGRRLC